MNVSLAVKPPDGMLDSVIRENEGWQDFLIYRAGWYKDAITGMKETATDCRCTACGSFMKLGRDYQMGTNWGKGPTFGVCWGDKNGWHKARNGDEIQCPECGRTVRLVHVSSIADAQRYAWIMTAERQGDVFLLYFWRIDRNVSKGGGITWSVKPWEAYSFHGGRCQRHSHWYSYMGRVGIGEEWTSLKGFRDEIRNVDRVYCPEGLDMVARGTEMENSKLELYMKVEGEWLFPVTWCRIFQKHPKAEILMTGRAAKLVAGMIAREKREHLRTSWGYVTEEWNSRTDLLRELNWRKKKPHELLRIEKDVLPYFTEKEREDGAERLLALIREVKAGIPCRPGEEAPNLTEEEYKIVGAHGLTPGKVDRYLEKQKQKYPNRHNGKTDLWDYWRMAEALGIDLRDPEELLPQNLERAHDRCVEQQKAEKKRIREEGFRRQFETLREFEWDSDGILIRPVRDEAELITEGKTLHHCVASYAQRIADGKTAIFLIRQAETPEKPWYTLELDVKNQKVIQNRGERNCDRTPEVEAFEKAWLQWLRTKSKRKEKKAA